MKYPPDRSHIKTVCATMTLHHCSVTINRSRNPREAIARIGDMSEVNTQSPYKDRVTSKTNIKSIMHDILTN